MQGNQYMPDPAFEDNPYLTDYGNVMPPGGGNGGGGGNGDCTPCYDPNPPGWCNNPNNPCYDCCNVPLEVGPLSLVLTMVFGILLILKQKQNEKVIFNTNSGKPRSL